MGIYIGDDRLSCILYADDIVIMSECGVELQRMLDIVTEYGRDFDVKFGTDKSLVLIINGGEEDIGCKWKLGESEINRTNEYIYHGCVLNRGVSSVVHFRSN